MKKRKLEKHTESRALVPVFGGGSGGNDGGGQNGGLRCGRMQSKSVSSKVYKKRKEKLTNSLDMRQTHLELRCHRWLLRWCGVLAVHVQRVGSGTDSERMGNKKEWKK